MYKPKEEVKKEIVVENNVPKQSETSVNPEKKPRAKKPKQTKENEIPAQSAQIQKVETVIVEKQNATLNIKNEETKTKLPEDQ